MKTLQANIIRCKKFVTTVFARNNVMNLDQAKTGNQESSNVQLYAYLYLKKGSVILIRDSCIWCLFAKYFLYNCLKCQFVALPSWTNLKLFNICYWKFCLKFLNIKDFLKFETFFYFILTTARYLELLQIVHPNLFWTFPGHEFQNVCFQHMTFLPKMHPE